MSTCPSGLSTFPVPSQALLTGQGGGFYTAHHTLGTRLHKEAGGTCPVELMVSDADVARRHPAPRRGLRQRLAQPSHNTTVSIGVSPPLALECRLGRVNDTRSRRFRDDPTKPNTSIKLPRGSAISLCQDRCAMPPRRVRRCGKLESPCLPDAAPRCLSVLSDHGDTHEGVPDAFSFI